MSVYLSTQLISFQTTAVNSLEVGEKFLKQASACIICRLVGLNLLCKHLSWFKSFPVSWPDLLECHLKWSLKLFVYLK